MYRQLRRYLFLLAAFSALQVHAQDPVFTQFATVPLAINPAFAGTTYAPRIAAAYRNEWPSHADVGTAYETYAVSYDQFFELFNSGFGLLAMADNAGGGLLKSTWASATYAYRVSVSDEFAMKFGVQAGFRQMRLDWDRLVFLDQLDPIYGPTDPAGNPNPTNELPPEQLTRTHFDVSAGLLAYGEKFYGGISLYHLTTPHEGFIRSGTGIDDGLPLRLSLQAGAEFTLIPGNNRIHPTFIAPALLFVKQGDQGQVNLGAILGNGPFAAGIWYRQAFTNADAVIASVSFQYQVFKIGYSFDFTVADGIEVARSGGTHEITLLINLDQSESAQRRRYASRYNDCFQIFR